MRDDRAVRNFSAILRVLLVVSTVYVAGPPMAAQSSEPDVATRLIGKPLYLRGFWMDDKLKFDGAGQPAKNYRSGTFTESGMEVTKVRVGGDHMQIEGLRIATTFSHEGVIYRAPVRLKASDDKSVEKMSVEVDGHGVTDFGVALDAIFSDGLEGLVPLLPDYWQPYAKKRFGLPPDKPVGPMDVNAGPTEAKEAHTLHVGGGVKPPRVVSQSDPEFSEFARRQKFSGNVEIYLWAGVDGRPSHIAIARPVGYGLDEKAVEAVSRYRFQPAMRNGEPVAVDLYIDVNFQIF